MSQSLAVFSCSPMLAVFLGVAGILSVPCRSNDLAFYCATHAIQTHRNDAFCRVHCLLSAFLPLPLTSSPSPDLVKCFLQSLILKANFTHANVGVCMEWGLSVAIQILKYIALTWES